MKLKNKLKSFYRHNKKCFGMWMVLLHAAIALAGSNSQLLVMNIGNAMLWSLVWIHERRVDTLKRLVEIQRHLAHKAMDRLYKEYQAIIRNLLNNKNE